MIVKAVDTSFIDAIIYYCRSVEKVSLTVNWRTFYVRTVTYVLLQFNPTSMKCILLWYSHIHSEIICVQLKDNLSVTHNPITVRTDYGVETVHWQLRFYLRSRKDTWLSWCCCCLWWWWWWVIAYRKDLEQSLWYLFNGGSDPGFLICDVVVVVLSDANDVGSIISLLIDDTAVSDEAHWWTNGLALDGSGCWTRCLDRFACDIYPGILRSFLCYTAQCSVNDQLPIE